MPGVTLTPPLCKWPQGYNFTIQYRPGTETVLANTLSRLPNPKKHKEIPLDVQVHTMDLEVEDPERLTIALINIRKEKQDQLREETKKDPCSSQLPCKSDLCWLAKCHERVTYISTCSEAMHTVFRDELAIEAGVILYNKG